MSHHLEWLAQLKRVGRSFWAGMLLCVLPETVVAQIPTPTPPLDGSFGLESGSGTMGGAVEFEHPKMGKGVFNFQVGLENFEAPQDQLQPSLDRLVEIERTTGDGIIEVFQLEGAPDITLPQSLENQLVVQRIVVPRAVLQSYEKIVGKAKDFWKSVYRPPTVEDKVLAVTFMSLRGVIAGSVFFSDPTLGWQTAMLMTLSVTGATGFNNLFGESLTNLFAHGVRPRTTWLGNKYAAAIVWMRTLAWDVGMAVAINEVGGRNTVRQATVNGFFSNMAGSGFSSDRGRVLIGEESRERERAIARGENDEVASTRAAQRRSRLSFAYKLLLNPFMFAIQAFDNLGNVQPVFAFLGYEVRPTILATLGIYAGLVVIHNRAQEPLIRLLDQAYNRSEPKLNWLIKKVSPSKRTCQEIYNPEKLQARRNRSSLLGDELPDASL